MLPAFRQSSRHCQNISSLFVGWISSQHLLNLPQPHSTCLNLPQPHSTSLNLTQSHSTSLNLPQPASTSLNLLNLPQPHSISLNLTQSPSISLNLYSILTRDPLHTTTIIFIITLQFKMHYQICSAFHSSDPSHTQYLITVYKTQTLIRELPTRLG